MLNDVQWQAGGMAHVGRQELVYRPTLRTSPAD
jgi:hypothetical protein